MNLEQLSKELEIPWSTLKLRYITLGFTQLTEKELEVLRNHFRKGESEPGFYNNGKIEVKVKKGFLPPEGYVKGRLKSSIGNSTKGLIWVTDGQTEKMVLKIPEGFVKGRLSDTFTKRENTCLERYGVKSNLELDKTSQEEKRKRTCLERYGGVSPTCSLEVKEKIKATCLERYGTEYAPQSQDTKEKIKRTCLERYGVENFLQIFWQNLTTEQKLEIRRKSNKKNKYQSKDGETFDSSWELAYYEYCLEKGYNIIREPIGLEYEYLGTKHLYYPDFEVEGKLIEIKGNYLKDSEGKWLCPFKNPKYSKEYLDGLYEAKRQCAITNNVTILYQEDLERLGIGLFL